MKKVLSLLILALTIVSCKSEPKSDLAPNTYQVNATAKGIYNGMRAYIKHVDINRKEITIDTAIVMNEAFSFDGEVKSPSLKVISIDGIKQNLPFVLEAGTINIDINKENIYDSKIEGPQNNQEYQTYLTEYKNKTKTIDVVAAQLRAAKADNNKELHQELYTKRKNMITELNEYAFDFIKERPNSQFSLILLESIMVGKNQNIEKFKESVNTLSSVINQSPENKLIGRKIESFIYMNESKARVNIGKVAPDFSAPTPDGKQLALNDIKGKATIIDFWASWCRPCRVENPNVVKVYEKYHDKGLEIISVSLDKKGQKDRWLKAIEDDNLQWHHVSNLKYWNEPVAKMYNVSSIPATFILDAEGKIVAKKLRGKALEDKIAELLD